MSIVNIMLILIVLILAMYAVYYLIKKKQNAEIETEVNVDDKTYTLDMMTEFVKKRLNEITKVNLYDIRVIRRRIEKKKTEKI